MQIISNAVKTVKDFAKRVTDSINWLWTLIMGFGE